MNHPRFTAWLCSAAALVLLAVPAFAQQPDALPPEQAAPAAQEQTEIVVTGSRIARPEFDTVQPTQVVGAAQIESRGYTNVGQALRSNVEKTEGQR